MVVVVVVVVVVVGVSLSKSMVMMLTYIQYRFCRIDSEPELNCTDQSRAEMR